MADASQERLDDLGEQIDRARRDAEEDGLLPDTTPEPTFIDPDPEGEDAGERIGNDQIAPPG